MVSPLETSSVFVVCLWKLLGAENSSGCDQQIFVQCGFLVETAYKELSGTQHA